jgi:DNA-binding IclR family transcriptional regulator
VNDRTPSDVNELRRRIAQIAVDGVLWSFDDLGEGITAIDVPFRGASGQYEGALFVNAPSYRFPPEGEKDHIQQLVVDAAARLSERFTLH